MNRGLRQALAVACITSLLLDPGWSLGFGVCRTPYDELFWQGRSEAVAVLEAEALCEASQFSIGSQVSRVFTSRARRLVISGLAATAMGARLMPSVAHASSNVIPAMALGQYIPSWPWWVGGGLLWIGITAIRGGNKLFRTRTLEFLREIDFGEAVGIFFLGWLNIIYWLIFGVEWELSGGGSHPSWIAWIVYPLFPIMIIGGIPLSFFSVIALLQSVLAIPIILIWPIVYWPRKRFSEISVWTKAEIPILVRALRDHDSRASEAARLELVRMGSEAEPAVPALIKTLRDSLGLLPAIDLLSRLGGISDAAVEAMEKAYKQSRKEDPVFRQSIVHALAAVHPASARVQFVLHEALLDEDSIVRKIAQEGIRSIAQQGAPSQPRQLPPTSG